MPIFHDGDDDDDDININIRQNFLSEICALLIFYAAYNGSSLLRFRVTDLFPGRVKQPKRGVDHPPPSKAEFKERVELYFYSPLGLHGQF
jgi:hypothetical protein